MAIAILQLPSLLGMQKDKELDHNVYDYEDAFDQTPADVCNYNLASYRVKAGLYVII